MIQPGQIVKVRFQDMGKAQLWKWVNAEVVSVPIPVDSVVVKANLRGREVLRRVHPAAIKELK